LGASHKFPHQPGYAGLASFLERNPKLSLGRRRNRRWREHKERTDKFTNFFNILEAALKETLLNKPQSKLSVDESGIQLINKTGIAAGKKGAKDMYVFTPHVTVLECCGSEGQFLPSVLILKLVSKKQDFGDCLFHGPELYMNPKSSYIRCFL
jgi:hypothetical protein